MMEGTPGNVPVMPIYDSELEKLVSSGLTKREYFAAMAMQGLLANSNVVGVPEKLADGNLAIEGGLEYLAVALADSLIDELNDDE